MASRRVFHGRTHRVQLSVYDHREPVMFCVCVLEQRYHSPTAFSGKAGKQVYYGDCLASAWGCVYRYAPDAELPQKLKKYFWPELTGKPLIEVLHGD